MKGCTAKGYLYAIISAVIYGCMPLMAKYIYADGVTPLMLVFLRNTFSLIPLGILAYAQNKTLKIPPKKLPSVFLISVLGCCATPILLFSSYSFMESGTATVFHFVYPAIVLVLELFLAGKKTNPANLLSILVCVAGICMFYSPQQNLSLTGSLLALSSGLTFAVYVVMLSHFDSREIPGFLFTFYITAVSSIVSFSACLVTGDLSFPSTSTGWGLCILFSLLVTTGAVSLFQKSAFLIGSERTSILSALEPITGIIVGVIVFKEQPGVLAVIGSALVVLAGLLIALADLKRTANKKQFPKT